MVLMFLIQNSQVSSLGFWSLCVFNVFNVFKSIKGIKNINPPKGLCFFDVFNGF